VLGLGEVAKFCLLVIDGLGWQQILEHGADAPVLAEAAGEDEPLTAGFPATTAASLGSLATGLPPGEHGLVGYTFLVPGLDRPMNALLWEPYGLGADRTNPLPLDPREAQPHPTALERAAAAGVDVVRIGPPPHEHSGFTRAAIRGGRYRGAYWFPDLRETILDELAGGATAVYAYHPDLDTAGHSQGPGSPAWLSQLSAVDQLVESLASHLPSGSMLAVTSDNGMIRLDEAQKLDLVHGSPLLDGVRFLAGEARARHVYTRPDAAPDVLAAWQETLGDRMWVAPREEAMGQGWFGPRVEPRVAERIGEVVAAAHADVGVFQKTVDPFQASLIGHHGSMTPAEQLVPFLLFRP